MRIREGNIKDIHDRTERGAAKLARIARNDCVFGGAKAMVIADRLDGMGSAIDAQQVVSDVYTKCNGNTPADYRASVCPECGTTVLGEEAALNHCFNGFDDDNYDYAD